MKKIFKSISKYFKGVKKETSRIRWTSSKDLVKYSITTVTFMLSIINPTFTGASLVPKGSE